MEAQNGDLTTTHFALVPLLAQGHMIPMIDMALLLSRRPGVLVTLFTTPVNAARSRSLISGAAAAALPIRFVELPFPCSAVGLPDGFENIDLLSSRDHYLNFFAAAALLAGPIESHLRLHHPPATCIISDMCLPWTSSISSSLSIPRLVFHCQACFAVSVCNSISRNGLYRSIAGDDERFAVPGLPWPVETTKAEAPGWDAFGDAAVEAEATADGVVLNSFRELESEFIDGFQRVIGKRVFAIGPLCVNHEEGIGNSVAAGSKEAIFEWLNGKEDGSVVYLSFGSIASNGVRQLREVGMGLLAGGSPFVWVVNARDASAAGEWLPEFMAEAKEKGMVVAGWAPQMEVLCNRAVGGFVTHCGWNSVMEAVVAGVPMVTWPHVADQFLNEKLVVEVLKVGVKVGSRPANYAGMATREEVMVGMEKVAKAVRKVMAGAGAGDGEDDEEGDGGMRERMKGLSEKAKKAVGEGGSSKDELAELIRFVNERKMMMKIAGRLAAGDGDGDGEIQKSEVRCA